MFKAILLERVPEHENKQFSFTEFHRIDTRVATVFHQGQLQVQMA